MVQLISPTLLVDKAKCLNNINLLARKAKQKGIDLRPHFKTHQSKTIGKWFKDFGIDRIAVSSVPMAQYFANDGWKDITIAFPFVAQQAHGINTLARSIKLQLCVSSIQNAKLLCEFITENIGVYIEIDTGQGRSGFCSNDIESISKAVELINLKPNFRFLGFLAHAGQTYNNNPMQVIDIHNKAIESLVFLKNRFTEEYPDITISYGDTPSSMLAEDFEGIDELRPGNFAFFDMQQSSNGVCRTSDIAAALACPVVAVYPDKGKAIIWGGAVHLSKDHYILPDGKKSFGAVCRLNNDLTWSVPIEGLYLESVSQEHGVIKAENASTIEILKEGEFVAILPAHICLTVSCMGELFIPDMGFTECLSCFNG
jgi:D-serine deaminase-like pyridoxal phosphate-dependent protein